MEGFPEEIRPKCSQELAAAPKTSPEHLDLLSQEETGAKRKFAKARRTRVTTSSGFSELPVAAAGKLRKKKIKIIADLLKEFGHSPEELKRKVLQLFPEILKELKSKFGTNLFVLANTWDNLNPVAEPEELGVFDMSSIARELTQECPFDVSDLSRALNQLITDTVEKEPKMKQDSSVRADHGGAFNVADLSSALDEAIAGRKKPREKEYFFICPLKRKRKRDVLDGPKSPDAYAGRNRKWRRVVVDEFCAPRFQYNLEKLMLG